MQNTLISANWMGTSAAVVNPPPPPLPLTSPLPTPALYPPWPAITLDSQKSYIAGETCPADCAIIGIIPLSLGQRGQKPTTQSWGVWIHIQQTESFPLSVLPQTSSLHERCTIHVRQNSVCFCACIWYVKYKLQYRQIHIHLCDGCTLLWLREWN